MSVQTDPYSFVNGTVADALQVNARFNPLYTVQNGGIDSANMNLTGSFAWTGQHSFTGIDAGTSVTSTTANVASVIIRNTNTTVNNFQSVDFKNDTGAIVGRIACINADHTAASEDVSYSVVGMLGGTLKTFYSVNTTTITGANNIVISDGAQSIDQGMSIYTADNKTGYYGFTDNASALQGYVSYSHTTDLLSLGAGGAELVTIGTATGVAITINDATTTITSGWASRLALTNSNATTNAGSAVEMYNSSGVLMGKIACVNTDNTAASEASQFSLLTMNAGTLNEVLSISGNLFRFKPAGTERLQIDGSAATTTLMSFSNCQQTTGNVISISAADSLTSGSIFNFVSNSSSSTVRYLGKIINDNTSATSTTNLFLRQDADYSALIIQKGTGFSSTSAPFSIQDNLSTGSASAEITMNASSGGNTYGLSITASNVGAGDGVGIDLSGCDVALRLANAGGAAGAYYGRTAVYIAGVGNKYMHLFSA